MGGAFQNDPPVPGDDDFETAARIAGDVLQKKARGMLTQETEDQDLIKDAFWGYNGRAKWQGSYDRSSYVMNKFDANHMGDDGKGMLLKGTLRANDGSRVFINHPDSKYGAWTMYAYLKTLGW